MMRKVFVILMLMVFVFSNVVSAENTQAALQFPELIRIKDFIDLVINVIRWVAGGITGLVLTLTGWQMLTNKEGKALAIAKSNFKDAVYACFFIFGGTFIADFFTNKMYQMLV